MKTATAKKQLLRWYLDQRATPGSADSSEPDVIRLRHELGSLTDLAKIGELVGPVAHEVNNFVNATMLQLAVLESKLSVESRADLAAIRQQAASLTAILEQLRQYRRRQQRPPRLIDLHRAIWRSIDEMNRNEVDRNGKPMFRPTESKRVAQALNSRADGIPVLMKLSAGLPKVNDSGIDLRNLCRFLLSHAAGATPDGGSISIRTVVSDSQVLFGVEDTGPNIDPALLPRIFEPSVVSRAGANSLELAACKGLVANLDGRIQAQNLPQRGVAICVELPMATSSCDD
jgi:signal transduction histidine kinase